MVASASYDRTIKRWNPLNGEVIQAITIHTDIVTALKVLQNGNLFSVFWDKTIKIWGYKKLDILINIFTNSAAELLSILNPDLN